ncbi:MAG: class I SAM-dependent methyltransferase [Peptostreptococcaceae bacterium]|jgi:16S rRNA C1402 N4-methylase RsmH|nr:class I SAM-dependent methyltransferase [Peptostreptococcaceae bacterium]
MNLNRLFDDFNVFYKFILKSKIKENDICIDATMGNGNDTLFLKQCIGMNGKVYAFDIQKQALENTKKVLEEAKLYNNVHLINDGHENMNEYIKETIDFIIFNLGYLPKGDKNLITKKETTIKAIDESLKLLKKKGIICIMSYYGHEGGMDEKNSLIDFLEKLNYLEYNIIKFDFLNKKNSPPILFLIEKK